MAKSTLLLVTTVDVGEGQNATISVFEGDVPRDVADRFCKEHKLPASVVQPLEHHLQQHLNAALAHQAEDKRLPAQPSPSARPLPGSSTNSRAAANASHSNAGAPARTARPASAEPSAGREDVHERLYTLALLQAAKAEQKRRDKEAEEGAMHLLSGHSMTLVSQELTKGRFAGQGNSGERMYLDAMLDLRKKQDAAEQRKAELAAAQVEGLTLHPEITQMAHQLHRGGFSTLQHLTTARSNQTQERLNTLKSDREREEVAECTFRPTINPSSLPGRPASAQERGGSKRFSQLYDDALQRHARAKQAETWLPGEYTFKPQLSARGVPDEHLVPFEHSSISACHRLWEQGKKTKARLEAARSREATSPVDSATGRPLFTPAINPPQKNLGLVLSPGSPRVGERLYTSALDLAGRKQEQEAQKARKAAEAAAGHHAQQRSLQLAQRLIHKRLAQIFRYLADSHEANAHDLDLAGMNPLVLDTLDAEVRADVEAARRIHFAQPRHNGTSHMDSQEEAEVGHEAAEPHSHLAEPRSAALLKRGSVSEADFLALMQQVLARSRGVPRSYLLPGQAGKRSEEPSFHPQIDARSKVLAARIRPAAVPLHELLYATAATTAQKMQQLREAKADALMTECTFEPELIAAFKAAKGRALEAAMQSSHASRSMLSSSQASPQNSHQLPEINEAADDKVSTAAASAALQSLLSRLTSKGPQEMPQDSPRYSQDPLGDTLGDTGYLAEPDSPAEDLRPREFSTRSIPSLQELAA